MNLGSKYFNSGTAFPTPMGAGNDGDLFWRTDLKLLFHWDNANGHWYTVNEYSMALPRYGTLNTWTTSQTTCLGTYAFPGGWNPTSVVVTKWVASVFQTNAPTSSVKVAFVLKTDDGSGTIQTIDTGFDTFTGGSVSSRWARYSRPQSFGAATAISSTVASNIYVTTTVTGTVGNCADAHAITYRLGV